MRTEFRLSGSGGQGLLLAGIVLADAAIHENLNVVQTQSYGPEARGGSSKAEVVISDTDIDYPKCTIPDYLLCLTADSYKAYGPAQQDKGVIIVDSSIQLNPEIKAKTVSVPIIETTKKVGKVIVTNMVALGVVGGLSGIVKQGTLEKAVLDRVPKGTEELNVTAIKAGFELASQVK